MLTTALLVGLAAAGLTAVIRAVAPLGLLVHKPVSCDLCMSWWGSLLAVTTALPWPPTGREVAAAALAVLGGVAVSLLLLKVTTALRDVPPL